MPGWTGRPRLQELAADLGLGVPEYLIEDSGPDHEKTFVARVRVGDRVYGHGTGRSKKEAEQQAAETGWRDIRTDDPTRAAAASREVDGYVVFDAPHVL